MNNKGFTMVEVLATFVIMALIIGIAFPAIDSFYKENSKRKYELYETALKTAGKLYVDQYDRDLWVNGTQSCVKIEYKDILCEGLIKKFENGSAGEKVDENNTYVNAIKKQDGSVVYEVHLAVKKSNKIMYTSSGKITSGCSTSCIKGCCSGSCEGTC